MPTQLNPNPNHTFTLFYFIIIISKPTDQLSTTQKSVLTESIYSAAFGAQNPAGKAHYSTTPLPTTNAIQTSRDRAYNLNGAVLAATGIPDHEQFVQAVNYGFSESPNSTGTPHPTIDTGPTVFIGGETRVHTPPS